MKIWPAPNDGRSLRKIAAALAEQGDADWQGLLSICRATNGKHGRLKEPGHEAHRCEGLAHPRVGLKTRGFRQSVF